MRWGQGYQDNFVRPTKSGFVRDVVSGFKAEDIYGEKRTEMETGCKPSATASSGRPGFHRPVGARHYIL
jgi:hypothetical protein